MYDALANLDSVKLNFSESSILFLNITLALVMVGVALGVRLKRFKKVLLAPKSLIIGLMSQLTRSGHFHSIKLCFLGQDVPKFCIEQIWS